MHDPMVQAFTIPWPWPKRWRHSDGDEPRWAFRYSWAGWDIRPRVWRKFWQVAGKGWYWKDLVVVWHVEPGGHDSGEVCKHWAHWQDDEGEWHFNAKRSWRWHVHHWKIEA